MAADGTLEILQDVRQDAPQDVSQSVIPAETLSTFIVQSRDIVSLEINKMRITSGQMSEIVKCVIDNRAPNIHFYSCEFVDNVFDQLTRLEGPLGIQIHHCDFTDENFDQLADLSRGAIRLDGFHIGLGDGTHSNVVDRCARITDAICCDESKISGFGVTLLNTAPGLEEHLVKVIQSKKLTRLAIIANITGHQLDTNKIVRAIIGSSIENFYYNGNMSKNDFDILMDLIPLANEKLNALAVKINISCFTATHSRNYGTVDISISPRWNTEHTTIKGRHLRINTEAVREISAIKNIAYILDHGLCTFQTFSYSFSENVSHYIMEALIDNTSIHAISLDTHRTMHDEMKFNMDCLAAVMNHNKNIRNVELNYASPTGLTYLLEKISDAYHIRRFTVRFPEQPSHPIHKQYEEFIAKNNSAMYTKAAGKC